MTALYPSTSAAQVFVPLPVRLSTTGAAAPITPAFAPAGVLANLFLTITEPTGNLLGFGAFNALPAGVTVDLLGFGFLVTIDAGQFLTAGQYACFVSYTPDTNYQTTTASFQWGGWIDTLLGDVASIDASTTGTVQILSNRVDVDDPNAPTTVTVYQLDDVTPLRTRTIANADGSPVNPAQILRLGRYV